MLTLTIINTGDDEDLLAGLAEQSDTNENANDINSESLLLSSQ